MKRLCYIIAVVLVAGVVNAADLYYGIVTVYYPFWSKIVQIEVIVDSGVPAQVRWTNGTNGQLHDMDMEDGAFWGHDAACRTVSIVLGSKIRIIRYCAPTRTIIHKR